MCIGSGERIIEAKVAPPFHIASNELALIAMEIVKQGLAEALLRLHSKSPPTNNHNFNIVCAEVYCEMGQPASAILALERIIQSPRIGYH